MKNTSHHPLRKPFSLIEILIVASSMVLIIALTIPRAASMMGVTRFNHGLRSISGFVEITRHRAVAMKQALRIFYSPVDNIYWSELILEEDEAKALLANDENALKLTVHHMPDSVELSFVAINSDEVFDDEAVSFDISADGRLANHRIYVNYEEMQGTVDVNGLTGIVRIYEEERLYEALSPFGEL